MKWLKVLTRQEGNCLSVIFISCFTVSIIPSINLFESSNDFMFVIISFISSIDMNWVNPFPSLTAPFPFLFLSSLFIAFEAKLLINPGKVSLAKGITTFISVFLPKLGNQELKDPPDWII